MDIVEFLEARIAEDEQAALLGSRHNLPDSTFANDNYGCLLVAPERIRRECEAKRSIIEEYTKEQWVVSQGHNTEWTQGGQAAREGSLQFLAAVYSDHPDYRPDWLG